MFESLKSVFENLKSLWLAFFLKNYIKPDNRPPRRYPEQKPDTDLPQFRDRYFERTSDPKFIEVDERVKQAVANLKSKGQL